MNPNYTEINAEAELADENSIFYYYKRLIRLRKDHPVFADGEFELLLEEDEQIFAYTRSNADTKLLVCVNFSDKAAECPALNDWENAETLIRNYPEECKNGQMCPYEAVIKIM